MVAMALVKTSCQWCHNVGSKCVREKDHMVRWETQRMIQRSDLLFSNSHLSRTNRVSLELPNPV